VHHIETIVRRQQELAKEVGERETCAVVDLVEAALGLSRAGRVDVRIEIDDAVRAGSTVMVDRPRVLQILVNLLENACDAIDQRGAITMRARTEVDAVVFEVADDGRGIAPELSDRIFTRGFTTKPHGHGFGLHGSFSLAQAMGGALSFESAGIGRGTVFRLRLPLGTALAA
jgi:signal transduction histidine kinase